ncbi:MAG: hypothetical protein IJR59_02500, partial [Firmicutes bacterium]|nr:hypothetical protein [Bacillota bacterium]
LLLSGLDRYRPYFCRKNILWLLGALAAAVFAYQPVKLFFLYGTYYIINIYTYFAEVRAAKIFYIVQKVVLALIAAAVLHFGLKEKARYIVMTVVSAIVPLAGLFISGDLLDLHWCIILLFVTVASIYITLYCKNKYKVRLTVQLFGIMGLMEAAAVYLLEINQ